MDKKKGIILAIVLFLLIGLGTFVFASPSEDVLDGNGTTIIDNNNGDDNKENQGNTNTDDTATGDDTVKPVNGASSTKNPSSSSSSGQTTTDNSYKEALNAVVKAEGSLLQEDIDAAKALVENLSASDNKTSLEDRITAVQNLVNLNNVSALVAELEKLVNESKNIDDMNDSRDYRTDKEVVESVTALEESDEKKELLATLEKLAEKLDDTTAPLLDGVPSSATNQPVTITVDDINEVTMLLGTDEVTADDLKDIISDGVYTLTVTDSAFNTTVVSFTIDTNKPKFNVSSGTHSKENIEIVVDDETFDYALVYNQDKDTENPEKIEANEFTLTEEATYKLIAFDEAGNKSATVYVAIDKTKPLIEGLDEDLTFNGNDEIKITVSDKFLKEVTVNGEKQDLGKPKKNGEYYEVVLKPTEDGVYTIIAKDKVGYDTVQTFTIDTKVEQIVPVNILVLGDINEQSVFYAKKEDKINVYFRLKEELREIPKFYLVNNGNEIEIENVNVSGPNAAGEYKYSATYKILDDTKLTDGEVTLKITDIYDVAGNRANDVTKPSNGHKVYYDNTPVRRVYSTLDLTAIGKESILVDKKINTYYVKNGEKFTFRIRFDEELAETPILTIGGRVTEFNPIENLIAKGEYVYEGTFEIDLDEKELAEGQLEIVLSNIVDLAGNVVETSDQTITSNSRTVIYDRTAANRVYSTVDVAKVAEVIDKVNYYYVTNGDSFKFRIQYTEELANVPKVTIGGRSVEMYLLKNVAQNEGKYVYEGLFEIDLNEKELVEGQLEIKVDKVYDKAGNETVASDQTVTSNSRTVIYDRSPVERVFSNIDIAKKAEVIDKVNYYYVKNGNEFTFRMRFNEELLTTPTLTIGGRVTEFNPIENLIAKGEYVYQGTFKIPELEKELTEGQLTILVSATDKAGNTTNFDSTITSNWKTVIYDRTPAVIDGVEKTTYTYDAVGVTPTSSDTDITTVLLTKDGQTVENYELGTAIKNAGSYVLTVTDKAENITTVSFVIEKATPTIIWSGVGSVTYDAEKKTANTVYNGQPQSVLAVLKKFEAEENLEVSYYINGQLLNSAPTDRNPYEVKVSYAGDENYNSVDDTITFVISKFNSTFKFTKEPSNYVYDGTAKEFEAVAVLATEEKELELTYYEGDTKLDSAPVDAGTYRVEATYRGDRNNNGFGIKSKTFTIEQAETEIVITLPENLVYSGSAKVATAKAVVKGTDILVADLNVVFKDANYGSLDYVPVNAGSYVAGAYYEATRNYKVSQLYLPYTIEKADLSIKFEAPASMEYDGKEKKHNIIIFDVNGVDVTNQTDLFLTYKIRPENTEIKYIPSAVGKYSLSVRAELDSNYNILFRYINYEITPDKTSTIDPTDVKSNNVFGSNIPKSDVKNIKIVDHINYPAGVQAWDISSKKTGVIMAWYDENTDTLYIGQEGGVKAPKDSSYLFYNYSNLEEIDVTYLNTSEVTDMNHMFSGPVGYYISKLTSIKGLDKWDTSNVTDMSYMFNRASKLTTLDVSKFNTSNVTNMSNMFYDVASVKSLDVSGFDTSKVTNMSSMFADCESLLSLNLKNFNTSNVTNMSYMFGYADGLTTLDLSSFDTSKVTDMSRMFHWARNLKEVDLSSFDTTNVTNLNSMFITAKNIKTTLTLRNKNASFSGFNLTASSSGAQLTLNYTTETEAMVDLIIAGKDPNCNIVKGVLVD